MNKPQANNDIFQRRKASARRRWHRVIAAAAVLALPLAASGLITWPTSAATSYAVTAKSFGANTWPMRADSNSWILPPGGRT
jgi:hypothetical protein